MYDNINELKISHSSMSLFNSCERKFEFQKLFQHPKRDESLAGEVGNALHEGFQRYLIDRLNPEISKEQAEINGIAAMMMRYPIHLCSDPNNFRSMEACYATMRAMMQTDILLEYELATIECLDGVVRPAVEVPFEIELTGISLSDERKVPVKYTGFIDLLLFNHLTNEYVVLDIKTHRDNSLDLTPKYRFSDQCLPYGIILERILGHELDGMTVKYMSVYVDIEKPTTHMYSFEVSKPEIRDWGRMIYVDVARLKTFYSMGWFPRRGNNCLSWKRPCKFFDICEQRNHETINKLILMGQEPYVDHNKEPWVKLELELAA